MNPPKFDIDQTIDQLFLVKLLSSEKREERLCGITVSVFQKHGVPLPKAMAIMQEVLERIEQEGGRQ